MRHASGDFQPVQHFLPMNLRWSHERDVFSQGISPGMREHCELGMVIDPQHRVAWDHDLPGIPSNECILALMLEVTPRSRTDLLSKGTYRLGLRVAASNCAPRDVPIELTVTGNWYPDEARMFSLGLGGRVLRGKI